MNVCSRRRRQLWAALLKKVWNIDALRCPKCGGRMKVISFIEQPFAIRRILKHLDLWEEPGPPPEPLEMVCEPNVDSEEYAVSGKFPERLEIKIPIGRTFSRRLNW